MQQYLWRIWDERSRMYVLGDRSIAGFYFNGDIAKRDFQQMVAEGNKYLVLQKGTFVCVSNYIDVEGDE